MGIADEEAKILEELQKIADEPDTEEKPTEELLKEIDEPEKEEEVEEEESEEETEEEETEEEEEEEEEVVDDIEEEEEEKLTGAKFRHKLKAEREEKEQLRRELEAMKIDRARQEGRAEAAPKQEVVEEIPDAEYEPEKYAIYQNKELRKEFDVMKADNQRLNAERTWEAMEKDHTKANPEYNEAKAFLIENETKKLKAQYPHISNSQIAGEVRRQELTVVQQAAQMGRMPTEEMEILAYRAGYRPGEKKEETPKKKANIKNIKRNAKKNASLIGGSSAGENSDSKTAQQMLDMSVDDIVKFGRDKYEKQIHKFEARG